MTLINAKQFQATTEKLQLLESRYAEIRKAAAGDQQFPLAGQTSCVLSDFGGFRF
jgi:hypothetical protein